MKLKYTLIAISFVLVSCNTGRNDPGWDFFPDMFYSTAYESYSENPNFRDGKTMREPAPGTVPRDYIPFQYTNDPESRTRAGNELINPFKPADENVERGMLIYNTFCNVCHGPAGEGDGHLFKTGLYPMKPRPLSGKAAAPLKDGEIYHTITLGFGSMGPYGSQVRPDDRWKIVLYIRQLQQQFQNSADTLKTGK